MISPRPGRTPSAAAPHQNYVARGLALSILLAAQSLPLPAQSLTDVFARMDKTAQQFKSIAADIRRTVHTAVINDDTVENGTIKVKREKGRETRMLIEFTGPDPGLTPL